MNLFLSIFVLTFHLIHGHSNRQVREILDEIHSESSDHYDGITVGAFEEKRLPKRDASDDDTKELTLETPSGTLRMHLKKRSVDLSGSDFYSYIDGLLEEIDYRPEDCFYSHDVDIDPSIRGTFSFCRGTMRGSIEFAGLHYDIVELPDELLFLNNKDQQSVLLRWKDASKQDLDPTTGLPVLEQWDDEPELDDVETTGFPPVSGFDRRDVDSAPKVRDARYVVPNNSVTVEIADYLDKWYVAELRRRLKVKKPVTYEDVVDFIIKIWAGVADLYSNSKVLGWNIKIRLVRLEIWEYENPKWYRQTAASIKTSKQLICENTKNLKVDHVMIHTGNVTDKTLKGWTTVGGICEPSTRCAAAVPYEMDHRVEANDLGLNFGLLREEKMNECKMDKSNLGFMRGSYPGTALRPCYAPRLDKSLRKESAQCLFKINYPCHPYREF